MASVTQRIAGYKQPEGGLLSIRLFDKKEYPGEFISNDEENIPPGLVGIAVDYLTRYMRGETIEEAFAISLCGASIISEIQNCSNLLSMVNGLDDQSIVYACKVVGYDVCYRAGPQGYREVALINPNSATIAHVRTMVQRTLLFFERDAWGPIIQSNVTLEGGYSSLIDAGDADYLTVDGLWELKTSAKPPTTKDTLQLVTYYCMGLHSIHLEFQRVQHIGFFNPRINRAYILPVNEISHDIINEVEQYVVGYGLRGNRQFSVKQIAGIMHSTQADVLDMINHGVLPATRINNEYWISDQDIEEFKAKWTNYRMKKGKRNSQWQLLYLVVIVIAIIYLLTR